MKQFYFLIYLFVLISTAISCKQKIESVGIVDQLIGVEIFQDEIGISSIYDVDDYLLLKMKRNVGYGFTLYLKSDLINPVASFATFGEGPDEWGAIRATGQTVLKNGINYLVLNDGFKNRIKFLNLDLLLSDSLETYDYTIDLDPKLGLTQSLYFTEDSILISSAGIDSWEPGRLKFLDIANDSSWTSPYFPRLADTSLNPHDYYMLYFSYIHYNPKLGLIASTMDAFDRVDVFDIEGELNRSNIGQSDIYLTENTNLKTDQGITPYPIYYRHSTSSDKLIYGLYYNQLNIEIDQVEINPKILVFDWQANLIKTFVVNENLTTIEVFQDDSFLIGIDQLNEKILIYDLTNKLGTK